MDLNQSARAESTSPKPSPRPSKKARGEPTRKFQMVSSKKVEIVNLWDSKEATLLLDGIKIAGFERDGHQDDDKTTEITPSDVRIAEVLSGDLKVSTKMFCGTCSVEFTDRDEQVDHFRSDWHRFNLRRKIKGENTVNLDKFEEITNAGDLSSISGSESSSEEEEEAEEAREDANEEWHHVEGIARRHPRVFLRNSLGQLFSVYRATVHGRRNQPDNADELIQQVRQLPKQSIWAVFMLAGGHFAGAVFDGEKVIEHKTFHRYVIRAKRGTVQSSRDNRGNAPKSGGASLRRHNEAMLAQEIQELLDSWSPHIQKCHRIFLRAPTYNKSVFYGGKNPVLGKTDPRIRLVPFQTRRPTFKELQRVHQVLATFEVYGEDSSIDDHITRSPSKKPEQTKSQSPPKSIHKPTKAEVMEDSAGSSDKVADWTQAIPDVEELSDLDDLIVESLTIDTQNLQPFEATRKSKTKKHKKPKSDQPEPTVEAYTDPAMVRVRNGLYTACRTGNTEQLQVLLGELAGLLVADTSTGGNTSTSGNTSTGGNNSTDGNTLTTDNNSTGSTTTTDVGTSQTEPIEKTVGDVLSSVYGAHGETLLHIAAVQGYKTGISLLLRHGAQPTVKDGQGKLPYIAASNKDTRNEFRRFMAKFPDMYDYTKAQIPGPLSEEQEKDKKSREAERKRQLKKLKKDRQKDEKAQEFKERAEQEEKNRFLGLSDREKRALAADRRLMSQAADSGQNVTLSRCYQCADDITGKVPFEYGDFKFCTPKCLKTHRLSSGGKKS